MSSGEFGTDGGSGVTFGDLIKDKLSGQ
jgi:hypothetical protein